MVDIVFDIDKGMLSQKSQKNVLSTKAIFVEKYFVFVFLNSLISYQKFWKL